MAPITLLLILVAAVAGGWGVCWLYDASRRRQLAAVARAAGVRYSPVDRFRLASVVARDHPTPGVADVVVRDVVHRRRGGGYEYVVTAEYTVGSVFRQARRRDVVIVTDNDNEFSVRVVPTPEGRIAAYRSALA